MKKLALGYVILPLVLAVGTAIVCRTADTHRSEQIKTLMTAVATLESAATAPIPSFGRVYGADYEEDQLVGTSLLVDLRVLNEPTVFHVDSAGIVSIESKTLTFKPLDMRPARSGSLVVSRCKLTGPWPKGSWSLELKGPIAGPDPGVCARCGHPLSGESEDEQRRHSESVAKGETAWQTFSNEIVLTVEGKTAFSGCMYCLGDLIASVGSR